MKRLRRFAASNRLAARTGARSSGGDTRLVLTALLVVLTALAATGCARAAGSRPGALPRLKPLAAASVGEPLAMGDGFPWSLPSHFPEPLVPADNPMSPARVELGRRLFYDRRLSGNGTLSCASCHRQERAFSDGRPRAVGSTGEVHPRNAMSLANVAYNASYDWADPDLKRLEEQMLVPMFNQDPVELGLKGREEGVLARLRSDARYPAMFAAAFAGEEEPLRLENVVKAIACFERTLISGGSAYDRFVFGGEREAMSAAARRGMRLFFSEALRCFRCHAGITFSGPIAHREAPVAEPLFHNTGLYNLGGLGLYPEHDPGLIAKTGRPEDMGRFRAPTLRNVELTAPYFHDGSAATLAEVLDHYAAGGRIIGSEPDAGDGRDNPHKSPLVRGFALDAEERRDLLAFLASLTDPSFVTDPRFSDPFPSP